VPSRLNGIASRLELSADEWTGPFPAQEADLRQAGQFRQERSMAGSARRCPAPGRNNASNLEP